MESTQEYLENMNKVLSNDYRTEDEKHKYSCFAVAREVEKRLLAEGKNPKIYWVRNAIKKDKIGIRDKIIPKAYEGRLSDWFVHIVAVADKLVFDPMIGIPVSIEDYCVAAFEGSTEILPCKLNYSR